jgi:hypothetical protein
MNHSRLVRALPSGAALVVTLAPVGAAGRLRVVELSISSRRAVLSEDLRSVPIEAIEREANEGRAVEEPLPDASALDRARFVEVYPVYARRFAGPVSELARRSGRKVPTLHTWLREARLRGQLPPGRERRGGTP